MADFLTGQHTALVARLAEEVPRQGRESVTAQLLRTEGETVMVHSMKVDHATMNCVQVRHKFILNSLLPREIEFSQVFGVGAGLAYAR